MLESFRGVGTLMCLGGDVLKIEDSIDLGNDHFRVLSTSF